MAAALFGYGVIADPPLRRAREADAGRGMIRVRRTARPLDDRRGSLLVWAEGPATGQRVAIFDVGDGLVLSCSRDGDFLIDAEHRTVVSRRRGGSDDAWEHRLVATAIPLLLAERGDLLLHASAVGTAGGECVLFCGPSGRGKSTLAASLVELGHPLLGEDGIAVTTGDDERPVAWPGPAGISRSWAPGSRKRTQQVPGSLLVTAPQALAAVVVLTPRGTGHEPVCRRVTPAEAVADLGPHAMYAGPDRLPLVFARIARLVERVPVLRAQMPDDLSALPAAARSLVAQAAAA
jgi:energy-coupling factor transporter ATP-binding protein EcfA2